MQKKSLNDFINSKNYQVREKRTESDMFKKNDKTEKAAFKLER